MWPVDLLKKISNSTNIAVLTGSGVSTESGISTFRNPNGLWNNFNTLELAIPETFTNNPKNVREWYETRRRQIARSATNKAYEILAWMEVFFQLTLITQNVDRLHQKARSRHPIELHGSL